MDEKRIVKALIAKHETNSPFIITDNLGITLLYRSMRNTFGFFSKYKRFGFIHLNDNLPEHLKAFVCAHELAHALMHADINTPFLKANTLFSTDKIEREANTFAVELLLPDYLLREYAGCSMYQIAAMVGIPDALVYLKSK